MIQDIRFTEKEIEFLLEVLETSQQRLAKEIGDTDAIRAKTALRNRERELDRLVERIRIHLAIDAQGT
jgi:hypothetical protein